MGGMDLRTRTSLFCGVLALAIAVSVLLKGKPRLPQLFFTGLAGDIGLWYLAQWLYHVGRSDLWARWTAVLAVLLAAVRRAPVRVDRAGAGTPFAP